MLHGHGQGHDTNKDTEHGKYPKNKIRGHDGTTIFYYIIYARE